MVRGLFTCPRCKGIVHGEAYRTGGTGYDQRGRYYHPDCYRMRKNDELRDSIRKEGVWVDRNYKMKDEDFQWYIDNIVQKVFVKVPGED
jgi:hypothetical protein